MQLRNAQRQQGTPRARPVGTAFRPLPPAQTSSSFPKNFRCGNGFHAAGPIFGNATLDLRFPGALDFRRIFGNIVVKTFKKPMGKASTIADGELTCFRFQAINGVAQMVLPGCVPCPK